MLYTKFVILVALYLPISEQALPVPPEFWKELRKMNSMQEFLEKYMSPRNGSETLSEHEDTEAGNVKERLDGLQSGPVFPCYPLNATVEVPPDEDPNVVRLPPCVVLPRCGGCCEAVKNYACLPTATTKVPVTVYKIVYDGTAYNPTPITILMDVHENCSCMCSITASNCNSTIHIFDSDKCSCQCINKSQCTSPKIWNETSCSCVCQVIHNCFDDEVFSFRTCRCEKISEVVALNTRAADDLADPCTSRPCRSGYRAVLLAGGCMCRPDSSAARRRLLADFPISQLWRRKRQFDKGF